MILGYCDAFFAGIERCPSGGLHLRIWADGRGCSGGESNFKKMNATLVGSNSTEGTRAL
jgi:hypothetical protein